MNSFSRDVSPDNLYKDQTTKFNYLGPEAKIYFKSPYPFNRGHLAAKADFVFGAQQISTFWLINAPPMWDVINNGNWGRLEDVIRNYAKSNHEVYTGTHVCLLKLLNNL